MLDSIGIFDLLKSKMDYTGQRHGVLAGNIANADTPGYRAMDLQPFEEMVQRSRFGRLEPTATRAGHIVSGQRIDEARAGRMSDPYEISPTGNEVVLEQQMMQITQNVLDHQLVADLYRRNVGMIRTALGRGGGGG